MIDQDRIVSNHPVTTEGNVTVVHLEDWDREMFRLPWLATDEQIAAVIAAVNAAYSDGHRIGQQNGRANFSADLRRLLGAPSQWEMDQAHERLDQIEDGR